MKKLFFVFSFLLIAVTFLNAQDVNNLSQPTTLNENLPAGIHFQPIPDYVESSVTMSDHLIKQEYLNKSRTQKTAAWWLLGGGLLLSGIGTAISFTESVDVVANSVAGIFSGNNNTSNSTSAVGPILGVSGLVMMAGSIPLFISAGKNKHRAILAVRDQPVPAGLPIAVSKNITGLTFSIPIGK